MTNALRWTTIIESAADAQQIELCLERDPHRPDASELRLRRDALRLVVAAQLRAMGGVHA